MKRVWPAFLLPLLVTGVTLADAAVNRRAHRGPMLLSSREAWAAPTSDDNSARYVYLQYQHYWSGEPWLRIDELAALGFDTSVDPASPDAGRFYGRALSREAYVALELDGPAWQQWATEQAQTTARWMKREDISRQREQASRLVAVDAALDAGTLRARYPDPRTHLITRAAIRVHVRTPERERPRLEGVVEQIRPNSLYVGRDHAGRLVAGKYEVAVNYGSRLIPWIAAINP